MTHFRFDVFPLLQYLDEIYRLRVRDHVSRREFHCLHFLYTALFTFSLFLRTENLLEIVNKSMTSSQRFEITRAQKRG